MNCTVIVDSREYETAEEVIKWLKRYDCTVVPRKLSVGDYIIPGTVGIERKKSMDLISSIVDGRLFDQSSELVKAYDKAYVIIEGDLWRAASRRNVHEHAIISSLALLSEAGVRILYTRDEEGTAYLIKSLAEKGAEFGIRTTTIKRSSSVYEAQIAFLSSLPGIGTKRAASLLRTFGTPLNALNNLSQWARKVDGINEKVVAMVRKILTTQYGNEDEQVMLSIDEAIKEQGEKQDSSTNKVSSNKEENKNTGHRITDYLGSQQ